MISSCAALCNHIADILDGGRLTYEVGIDQFYEHFQPRSEAIILVWKYPRSEKRPPESEENSDYARYDTSRTIPSNIPTQTHILTSHHLQHNKVITLKFGTICQNDFRMQMVK